MNTRILAILSVVGLGTVFASATAQAADAPAAYTVATFQYFPLDYSLNGGSYHEELYGDASRILTSQNGALSPGAPYIRSVANPFGTASAYSNSVSVPGWNISGSATIGYSVGVVGDSTYDGMVPISYVGRLTSMATAINREGDQYFSVAVADANLYVASNLGQASFRSAQCTDSCVGDYPSSLLVRGTVMTRIGSYVTVTVAASTQSIGNASATAYADPYFFIDPSFLAQNPGLSLQFSPFVGNDVQTLGAVPEPAIWAMMLAGFGMIGSAARRGQAVKSAVTYA